MTKEMYTKPESMVNEFATVDVITTSGTGTGSDIVTKPIDPMEGEDD